jgi:hypothetical protein
MHRSWRTAGFDMDNHSRQPGDCERYFVKTVRMDVFIPSVITLNILSNFHGPSWIYEVHCQRNYGTTRVRNNFSVYRQSCTHRRDDNASQALHSIDRKGQFDRSTVKRSVVWHLYEQLAAIRIPLACQFTPVIDGGYYHLHFASPPGYVSLLWMSVVPSELESLRKFQFSMTNTIDIILDGKPRFPIDD